MKTVVYRGPASDTQVAAGGTATLELAAESLPVRRVYRAAVAGYQLPSSKLSVTSIEVDGGTARVAVANRDANNAVSVQAGSVVLVALVEGE